MLRRRADVAVSSPGGSLQLEVEIKTRRGATNDWAARLLRDMLVHEAAPAAPYLMLALPDRIYMLDLHSPLSGRPSSFEDLPPKPDYEADAAPVFAPYLDGGDPERDPRPPTSAGTAWSRSSPRG